MSPPQAPSPGPGAARARRRAFRAYAGITAAALIVSAVMANLLADRARARWDVTAGGSQRLAARTKEALASLAGPARIVVATDETRADPRARQALRDALQEMQATDPRVRTSVIDTASASGVADYRALVAELIARDRATLDTQSARVEQAGAACLGIAKDLLESAAPGLAALSGAQSDARTRAAFEQAAALLRVRARDLESAVAKAREAIASDADARERAGAVASLVRTDLGAAALVAELGSLAADCGALARDLRALASEPSAPNVAEAVALATRLEGLRDGATRERDALAALPTPDVVRVASVLERGAAALVIGDGVAGRASSLVALDVEQLLPTASAMDASELARTDQRRRIEDLLASALQSLGGAPRPVVVFMHAELRPFMDELRLLDALRARLMLRGIDMVEWTILTQDAPPIATIDATGARPVVYFALSPDSAAAAPVQGGLSGAQRAAKLGEAIDELLAAGKPLAVALNPSLLPTYGERDPLARVVEDRLGVRALTGTPVLTEAPAPGGRTIETDMVLQSIGTGHPLARGTAGLPTYFTWCVPLLEGESSPKAGDATPVAAGDAPWRVERVFEVGPATRAWRESQWLRVRQTPREQRPLLPDPPVFDDGRDERVPEGGWGVVAAVEHGSARALVVGSNDWFIDAVTQQRATIDGRPALLYPGNTELAEAAIWWLAGEDRLIAQSAEARAAPMIRAMQPGELSRLRWGVILVPPLAVVAIGVVYRIARRR